MHGAPGYIRGRQTTSKSSPCARLRSVQDGIEPRTLQTTYGYSVRILKMSSYKICTQMPGIIIRNFFQLHGLRFQSLNVSLGFKVKLMINRFYLFCSSRTSREIPSHSKSTGGGNPPESYVWTQHQRILHAIGTHQTHM